MRGLEHEPLAGRSAVDRHRVRAQDGGRLLADAREHAREVEALVECLRGTRERRLARELALAVRSQRHLAEAGRGSTGERPDRLHLLEAEAALAVVGQQQHVGDVRRGRARGHEQQRARACGGTDRGGGPARLLPLEPHRQLGGERVRYRGDGGERRGRARQRLGVARDHLEAASGLVDADEQSRPDVRERARLTDERALDRCGPVRSRRGRQQPRDSANRLACGG
jgi:hypothetical protein